MTKFPSAAPTYDPEFIPEDEQDNRLDWSVNDAQAANTESSAYAYSCLAEHWNNFIRLCDEKSVDTSMIYMSDSTQLWLEDIVESGGEWIGAHGGRSYSMCIQETWMLPVAPNFPYMPQVWDLLGTRRNEQKEYAISTDGTDSTNHDPQPIAAQKRS